MALYFFRIGQGDHLGAGDLACEFDSRDAAFAEMTKVCGDLVPGISRSLKQNAEWQIDLLDEVKKPVFKIRLVAKTMG
jgi:hypothetical protein